MPSCWSTPSTNCFAMEKSWESVPSNRAGDRTDRSGQATVTVTLPENLTTWQMKARAVTADSLVGTSRFPAGTVGDLLTLTVAIGAGAAPGPAAWNLLASLGPSRTGVYDAALAELVLHPPLTNASGDAGDGLLLVDDGRSAWHNPVHGLDVNGDGLVTPLDAVIVINRLNAEAAGDAPASAAYYCDVNDDSFCTAQDVLIVINYLNAQALPAAEGEPSGLRDRVFHDLETELSPLESVLGDLADDVASVWR